MRAHLLFEGGIWSWSWSWDWRRRLLARFSPFERFESLQIFGTFEIFELGLAQEAPYWLSSFWKIWGFERFEDLKHFKDLEYLKYLSWDWRRRLFAGFPLFKRFAHKYRDFFVVVFVFTGFPSFEGLFTSIELGPAKIQTIGTFLEDMSTIPDD